MEFQALNKIFCQIIYSLYRFIVSSNKNFYNIFWKLPTKTFNKISTKKQNLWFIDILYNFQYEYWHVLAQVKETYIFVETYDATAVEKFFFISILYIRVNLIYGYMTESLIITKINHFAFEKKGYGFMRFLK